MDHPVASPKRSSAAGGWGALKSCGKHLLASGSPLSGARAMLKRQPARRLRLPGLRLGRSGARLVLRVLRERREGGRLGGDRQARDAGVLRAAHRDRAARLDRLRAGGRGPPDPADALRRARPTATSRPPGTPPSRRSARTLRGLDSPDQAEFYTSGRASNEAAFLYQLFARAYGTNNFPDCSNMCHEATGVGLSRRIGVGKGTVALEDFEQADAIFVIGQNPGTNHPRMLGDLRRAAQRGAKRRGVQPGARARAGALRRPAGQDRDAARRLVRRSRATITSRARRRHGGVPRHRQGGVRARRCGAARPGRPSLLDRRFPRATTPPDLEAYRRRRRGHGAGTRSRTSRA